MAHIGYARVSSAGQSLAVQREKLAHCDKVFEEKHSATTDARPQLQRCLDYVREGDTLVITKLDRLARSTLHLCQIADLLQKKGVALQVLDHAINTNDATGRLLFNMLGAIGQFETELRAERQRDGIANARARGVHLGRQPRLLPDDIAAIRAQRASGETIKTLMAQYAVSKATIYRVLAEV